jgi:hypothetical protein
LIQVKVDQKKLASLLRGLTDMPGNMATATSRAGNKTLTSTRAEMVRVIRRDYAIKAGDIRKELVIIRMTKAKLEGRVKGESSPGLPLIRFARISRIPSTKRTKIGGYSPKKGIPVFIRKDRGKRIVKATFLARMRSGHVGAFERINKEKGRRIKEVFGPTPIKLLGSKANLQKIDRYAQATMDKNLQHEADFILIKMGLK